MTKHWTHNTRMMTAMFVSTLFAVLLALHVKQATAACSLCFDGEAISKPDHVLDLSEPLSIRTCQDLVSVLILIPEEDKLCSSARAVSTLCGCPNLVQNACTICGNKNMSRPLQNLDGLVDLGDVDFFGLTPTCALVESGMNIFKQGGQACSSLPIDELQMYCGCQWTEDEGEDNDACMLCPGGEIVPENGVLLLLELNENGKRISCTDAHELVKGEKRGSSLCNDIQRGSTRCGCPVPENACQLCPDGSKVAGANFVDSIFGIRQSCESYFYQMHRYDRDSAECQSLDDNGREACGCDKKEEFVPCTLCPGGESVAYPNKEIVGMEGLGFDYVEPRCGTFEQGALYADKSDGLCSAARTLAKVCGCNARETSCSICEAGTSMTNPFGEFQWAFGSLSDSLDSLQGLYETIDTSDRKFTCELGDSYLSSLYDNEDDFCYWNQLIRGTACGCSGSNSTKVAALVWTQRCSGLLSLTGSFAIIVFFLTKKTPNRWNTYNQVVLSISVFDSLSSMAYIFGTALTPMEFGLYGSIGNEGTCTFQGTNTSHFHGTRSHF